MMHIFSVNFKALKVKTFFIILFVSWVFGWLFTYTLNDKYHFETISERSIQIQKQCLDHFLSIFLKHKIPILLFDIDILPELFQLRPKSWHKSNHQCKTLCKYHPEEKNVITFAVKSSNFEEKDDLVIQDLENLGYTVHLTLDIDPRHYAVNEYISYIPTYLWIAKNDYVIHVAFLHERLGSYFWIGPVREYDWNDTIDALSPALSDGWHSMTRIAAKFPTYSQAFDNSQCFLGLPLEIDGHKLNVPYFITKFLNEYRHSQFIECDYAHARKFKKHYETILTFDENLLKKKAKQLIIKAKAVLDGIHLPFWLSSGTCLGWYRQCDIIPYNVNVDFGIFIHDYSLQLVERMHENGLSLIHKFGKADDSLELSFIGEENIKLDFFFFYEESGYFWNGRTQDHSAQKYKYKFPKFNLCWTEFLQIKIRVPCDPKSYIEANYGKKWVVPVKEWQWNVHPPNMELNGRWHESEQNVAIQHFEKPKMKDFGQYKDNHIIDFPEELEDHFEDLGFKKIVRISKNKP